MSWRLFFGASIIGAGLLLKAGAPALPVFGGIALAAWVNRLRISAAAARAGASGRR